MFPRLFSIGGFAVPTYGVLVALGFLAGLWITVTLAKRKGLPAEAISNLAVYCALAGLLGAKLFMFLFDFGDYWRNPRQIFTLETLQSAGVYQGGFLLALAMAVMYMRRQHLPFGKTADVFAPGLAAGHAIGRLGCFAAGCCWGAKTGVPWAVTFNNPDTTTGVPHGIPLHPAQLYESAANLLIFGFLWRRIGKAHADGEILGWYLVLYSTARFLIEFLREHEQATHGGLSLTQWISIGTLALGMWLLRPGRVREPAPARRAITG